MLTRDVTGFPEPAPPVLSCSEGAQPGLVDSCCVETFGGLVVSYMLAVRLCPTRCQGRSMLTSGRLSWRSGTGG